MIKDPHFRGAFTHCIQVNAQTTVMSCKFKGPVEILCLSSTFWTSAGNVLHSFSWLALVFSLSGKKVHLQTYTSLFSETHTHTLGHPCNPSCTHPCPPTECDILASFSGCQPRENTSMSFAVLFDLELQYFHRYETGQLLICSSHKTDYSKGSCPPLCTPLYNPQACSSLHVSPSDRCPPPPQRTALARWEEDGGVHCVPHL